MLGWLVSNAGTIAVCALVLAVVALAARSLVRDKKRGKSSCGCGCSGCAMSGSCHGGAPTRGEK